MKRLIRFDWAVKKLLRNKANFGILEGFLSELFFDDIHIERILGSEANQENEGDKYNRVDILTQNSKKELIIVEIQNTYEIDYFHRMAYGASKALTENLSLGQKYVEIKKVISIHIVYFDLGQGEDYIYKGSTVFQGMHQNDTLTLSVRQKEAFLKEKVADIFPEFYIIKVNKFNDIAKDTLDEWIYFFKNSEVKDEFNARGLKEAGNVLDIMRLPDDDQYSYNRYLDYLHYKASEIYTLKTEEEFNKREAEQREKRLADMAAAVEQKEKRLADMAAAVEQKEKRLADMAATVEQSKKEIQEMQAAAEQTKIKLEGEKLALAAITKQSEETIRLDERRNQSIAMAEKSILKGLDNDTIAEFTNLTLGQVQEIRNNLAKE